VERFKNGWEPVFHFARAGRVKFRPRSVGHRSSRIPQKPTPEQTAELAQKYPDQNWTVGIGSVPEEEGIALPGNVVNFASSSVTVGHPAAFPVGLPAWFLSAYSDPGDLVFDPFMGSGTTQLAAEKTGRRARGCELSPAYCDVIVQRWEDLTGKKAALQ